jgi:cyclic-di-GMP phosphodiesterase TipF (flagellum assembly factor)
MIRPSSIFVAICMVLIAGSFAAVLYLMFGMDDAAAIVCGIVALTGLAIFNAVANRTRMPATIDSQIADLSRGTADLARQVAEQGRRLAALEKSADAAVNKALDLTQPVRSEIGELGQLVKQMAESIAAHELAIQKGLVVVPTAGGAMPPAAAGEVAPAAPAGDGEAEALAPAPAGPATVNGPFRGMSSHEVVALIRNAIDSDRIDIHLQPIVTLPQRKTRYYEALARLRTAEGQVIAAGDFIRIAEDAGLIARIDDIVLTRAMRVLRRLQLKKGDAGVFVNVSPRTLGHPAFARTAEFIEANRALAGTLILEFPYAAFRTLGTTETGVLSSMAKLGFRYSVDRVTSLRFETRELSERSCGFVKVPAAVLLDRTSQAASDIHPQDLSGLLGRYAIDLIVEKIESEAVVADLLDFEIKYAQGHLFSAARAVRPEAIGAAAAAPASAEGSPEVGSPDAAAMVPAVPADAVRPPGAADRASALSRIARVVGRN